jgi:hypothetical protein
MPFCPNCGLEHAPSLSACPRCGHCLPSPAESRPRLLADDILASYDRESLSPTERRLVVWEVQSVSAAIVAIAVAAINLLIVQRLTWSLYPLLTLACFWTLATTWRFFSDKPVITVVTGMVLLPLFLIGVNFAAGGPTWCFSIALPIALLVDGAVSLGLWLFSNIKEKGVNSIAFSLLLIVVVCVGIEATLDLASIGRLDFRWSAIVGFCLIPVAAFLLYVHYRVRKKTGIRRFFHL